MLLTGVAAAGLAAAACYPRERLALAVAVASTAGASAASTGLWLGVASVAIFFMGQGGLWAYIERIGASAGLSEREIATSLSICAAVGFLSSVLVLWLGSRVTRRGVVLGAVAVNLAAALTMDTHVPWLYAATISLYYFSLPLIATAQFGALTHLPDAGRAAVLASTATFGGFALDPATGGLIAEHFEYAAVRWLDIVLVATSGALLWPILPRTRPAAAR